MFDFEMVFDFELLAYLLGIETIVFLGDLIDAGMLLAYLLGIETMKAYLFKRARGNAFSIPIRD